MVHKLFSPAPSNSNAYINSMEQYQKMYQQSVDQPDTFWGHLAKENFHWHTPFSKVLEYNFTKSKGPIDVKWFEDGKTNICYNALDRQVEKTPNKVAFFWEGNDDKHDTHRSYTYKELFELVCKFANVLKTRFGVQKGDCVAIYLPMVIEAIVAVLACARIGAVHSVIFAGFSAESLANRILDSQCKVVITADGNFRGNKLILLKKEVDEACRHCEKENFHVQHIVVLNRLGTEVLKKHHHSLFWKEGRDFHWEELMKDANTECPVEWVNSEDPLFMLYTSGSTGKPKGLLHTVGGYMVYTATTFKYVFDYHENDVYWCGADVGWITGHSYIIYGPLLNGATQVLFEGLPTWPDASRSWQIIDKYQVTQFYTAPTLIRSLMKLGLEPVKKYSRKSLRVLGSVGEPINPEAWLWYYENIGNSNCSVVDTFWQTETGGHVLTPLPGCTPTKPGSATLPFFGVQPEVLTEKGEVLKNSEQSPEVEGFLCFKAPWPGIARTVFGDHSRYESTYFSMFDGYYVTGDGCKRDVDGYYWLTGRIDDVLNVSGHRVGTAEIESAFVSHKSVAECAVVPMPHDIKGQGIYCYVTLREGFEPSEDLNHALKQHVRHEIGAIVTPDVIHWAQTGLPKTRSGKIMRRILRKIASEPEDTIRNTLGDISTLADPSVVDYLIKTRPIKIVQ